MNVDNSAITGRASGEAEEPKPLVEVVDGRNRPLAAMSVGAVHRQGLNHRSVVVLVYDNEKKLYLRKRSSRKRFFPKRWDLSASGHVLAGESSLEAAHRALMDKLGMIAGGDLRQTACLNATPDTGRQFVTVYSMSRQHLAPAPNPEEVAEGYCFNKDEMRCLVGEFRGQITPAVVFFWESGLLFP